MVSFDRWRSVRLWGTALLLIVLAACAAPEPPQSGLRIAVAPLTLPGLSRVCYDLRVTNASAAAGETVWSRGTPAATPPDPDALCSDTYGNGPRGDLAYVAPCDASAPGGRVNSVTLWVDALYGTDGAPIAPGGPNGWQDPCPTGCTLDALCQENTDTPVQFNLTILRQANQGFFDVAVNFDDIFCSAKVDCLDQAGDPLTLLFNPTTQARDTTIVAALACTGGPSATTKTVLYRDPLVVTCDGTPISLSPAHDGGNVFTAAAPDPDLTDPIWQYAVYAGDEDLPCGQAPCQKSYWNVAIGLDPSADCTLTTQMTAAPEGTFDGLTSPANTVYPVIEVNVPLSQGGALTCTHDPVNGPGSGVTTTYTTTPTTFGHSLPETSTAASCEPNILTRATAYWPGEGDARDLPGDHDGSFPGTYGSGQAGQSFLTGTGSYVTIPDAPGLRFQGALTVATWARMNAGANGWQTMIGKAYGNAYLNSYGLGFNGSSIELGLQTTAGSTVITQQLPQTFTWTQWHHWALVWDGAVLALWLDGSLIVSTPAAIDTIGPILYDSHPVLLGADINHNSPGLYFNGALDEAAAFDFALSGAELTELMTATWPCDAYATCVDWSPSSICVCDPGTTGDGQTCTAAPSCAAILAAGQSTGDGIYTLMPQGLSGPSYPVYCDMTSAGGGWTLTAYWQGPTTVTSFNSVAVTGQAMTTRTEDALTYPVLPTGTLNTFSEQLLKNANPAWTGLFGAWVAYPMFAPGFSIDSSGFPATRADGAVVTLYSSRSAWNEVTTGSTFFALFTAPDNTGLCGGAGVCASKACPAFYMNYGCHFDQTNPKFLFVR